MRYTPIVDRRGRSKSKAKRAAARKNGKHGGRPRKLDIWVGKVLALHAELAPQFPNIDPGDLLLIIEGMVRDPCESLFFIFQRPDGGYDF